MKIYLVGGAVRDQLLGIANENTEQDWVVIDSCVEEMLDLGYRQVGKAFPVFLHPETQQEYALARLERKVAAGYTGFEFDTSKTITLEQDLSRRDLTINAMALDGERLIDPFHGQADLQNGLLKHTSAAFSEDPVRVLRVARFAAKFKPFGFKVAHSTHRLMQQMTASGEVSALTPERVFKELDKSLSYPTPSAFFKVLLACGAYQKVFPMLGEIQHKNHTNGFEFLDEFAGEAAIIKFAIWLHNESFQAVKKLCTQIKCPKNYQQLALLSSQWYGFAAEFSEQNDKAILEFFNQTDALRRKARFEQLLQIFGLLKIDIKPIKILFAALGKIKIAELKGDISKAIEAEKYRIIKFHN
ncbi:MAG: polynucleotide adenylyltransferase [Candidatus Thioglobus sp.]|nr:polynucleotide adenylyltransferase [Candidatus Thioglobus sp.]